MGHSTEDAMYTLYCGVTYLKGEFNLDPIECKDLEALMYNVGHIVKDEEDAVKFIMTIDVKKEE